MTSEFAEVVANGTIGVAFPASKSPAQARTIELASLALFYRDPEIGASVFHLAAFGRDLDQAMRALSLARLLRGRKGVQFYAGVKMVAPGVRIEAVLECYIEALSSNDWRAHCAVVVDEAELFRSRRRSPALETVALLERISFKRPPTTHHLFPCAFMRKYGVRVESDHPSSTADQLQAKAIEIGCGWCPKLALSEFRPL